MLECCHVRGLRQPTSGTSFTAFSCGVCSCAFDTCKQKAVDEGQYDFAGPAVRAFRHVRQSMYGGQQLQPLAVELPTATQGQ